MCKHLPVYRWHTEGYVALPWERSAKQGRSNSYAQVWIRIKDAPPSIHLIGRFIAKCLLSKSWYWKAIDTRNLARQQSWEPVKFLESNVKIVSEILTMNNKCFVIMKQFGWAQFVPNMESVIGSCKYRWYGIAQTEVSQHIRENIIWLDMMQRVQYAKWIIRHWAHEYCLPRTLWLAICLNIHYAGLSGRGQMRADMKDSIKNPPHTPVAF
jgi:hypothetical protein